jgi:hypothetical protein
MLTKGDKVLIRRGPLSGMEIILSRRDNANKAWYGQLQTQTWTHDCEVQSEYKPKEGLVMVWDYELVETIERKARKEAKRERV